MSNTPDEKMLEALKSLSSKLSGLQKESALYKIKNLERRIEEKKKGLSEEKDKNIYASCDRKNIEAKINKEKNIVRAFEKLISVDGSLVEDLTAKIQTSEKKIFFLKKHLDKAPDIDEQRQKFSKTTGNVKIKPVSIECDPLYEAKMLDFYIDNELKASANINSNDEIIINLENNIEFEIVLVGKDNVFLGMVFFACERLVIHGKDEDVTFKFEEDAELKVKLSFERETKLIRKNAEIVCVYKDGHALENYYNIAPFYCCVCNNIASLFFESYRCYKCKFTCHKKCANYILFKCPCAKSIETEKHTIRYDIPHILQKQSQLGLNWCNHCGNRISSSESAFKCTKCNQHFHESCSSFVFKSCGMEYDLRIKMADFKPPVSEVQEKDSKIEISDFLLIKVLGRGSFGKVMLAKYKPESSIIALKILKKESIVNANDLVYLELERKILKLVSLPPHPFLMKMEYCFQDSKNIYFGTEFLAGGDLFHLVSKSKFSYQQIKLYACEILLGLEYLHSKNVIYRDMKLDNVLLCEDGHAKIADFGLCKDNIGPMTITHTYCGTPDTIAPEIILEGGYTKDVDWWSYGVVIYEMFETEPPFNGATNGEMCAAILEKEVEFNSDIPSVAKDLILKLLQKDPKKRLGSGENDANEIKSHPFFENVNWEDVYNRTIKPEFIPKSNLTDNFDSYFIEEPILITPTSSIRKYDEYFKNFN
ncbi:C1-like protein kinase [Hamiltosporidium magnivora]|uniref:protein kinase C n=1 Tax=Hamiltosporidium magnivora TaxID=148818 RepID=A0A4Q9L768_9MICR|nr:C1-like protein kinase [Hamiltosporidium magnivora]